MDFDIPKYAQVNLLEPREIILHIRALFDLHDLLANGFEVEMIHFKKLLLDAGWSLNKIHQFIEKAAEYTRYEGLIDSMNRR